MLGGRGNNFCVNSDRPQAHEEISCDSIPLFWRAFILQACIILSAGVFSEQSSVQLHIIPSVFVSREVPNYSSSRVSLLSHCRQKICQMKCFPHVIQSMKKESERGGRCGSRAAGPEGIAGRWTDWGGGVPAQWGTVTEKTRALLVN